MFKLIVKSTNSIFSREFEHFKTKQDAMNFGAEVIQSLKDKVGRNFSSVSNNQWHIIKDKMYCSATIYCMDNTSENYMLKVEQMN